MLCRFKERNMWYYARNNQRIGPVDDSTVNSLIQNGTITRQTLVWQQGMNDWQQAAQSLLADKFLNVPPAPDSGFRFTNYSNPVITFDKESLRKLYIWFAWLLGAGLPLCLLCIGIPAVIAGTVIHYILLYRFWLLIQDGNARTSPGKAVGFCFIPFFNIYWIYVAIVGLSQDMNRYCDERNIITPRISEGLVLTWYILSLVSMIPYLGFLIALANIVIIIIAMKQFTDAAIKIMEFKKPNLA